MAAWLVGTMHKPHVLESVILFFFGVGKTRSFCFLNHCQVAGGLLVHFIAFAAFNVIRNNNTHFTTNTNSNFPLVACRYCYLQFIMKS